MHDAGLPLCDGLLDASVMFAELGQQIRSAGSTTVFDAVTAVAVKRVPGAVAASITTLESGHFTTVSATDDRARAADHIQYELDSGPCLDAILEQPLYAPQDLREDSRWPTYGRRVHRDLGWTSMLSYRLHPELATREVVAGLNIYSDLARAFDRSALRFGLLLATHAAMVVAAEVNRRHSENLELALETSREIGIAIGVLMTGHQLTREQGFDLLRIASQHTNRKLRDIATEVADTGALPIDLS